MLARDSGKAGFVRARLSSISACCLGPWSGSWVLERSCTNWSSMIADRGLVVFGIGGDEKVEVGGEKEAELVTMVGETNKKRASRNSNLEAKESIYWARIESRGSTWVFALLIRSKSTNFSLFITTLLMSFVARFPLYSIGCNRCCCASVFPSSTAGHWCRSRVFHVFIWTPFFTLNNYFVNQ